MRQLFNFLVCLYALLSVLPVDAAAPDRDFTKVIEKTFDLNKDALVELENKYGRLHIETWDKSQADIQIEVRIRADKESDANAIFNKLEVTLVHRKDYLNVGTNIGKTAFWKWKDWESFRADFEVNLTIKMPRAVELRAENKYGDFFLSELDNKANITVKYGNVKISQMNDFLTLDLAYGKASLNKIQQAQLSVRYGGLSINQSKTLDIVSQYSHIQIENAEQLRNSSKYDHYKVGKIGTLLNVGRYDDYKIGEIDKLEVESKYSDFHIDYLTGRLEADISYGDIRLDRIANVREDIRLQGKYTDFTLNVHNAEYRLDFNAEYTDHRIPSSVRIDKELEQGANTIIQGATGSNTARMIRVRCSYGDFTIRD